MEGSRKTGRLKESERLVRWLVLLSIVYIIFIVGMFSVKYIFVVKPKLFILILASTIPLFLFHKGSTIKLIGFFLVTYLAVMILEIINIRTAWIFGTIMYGANMGWTVMKVPLTAGIFWFGFIYCACIVVNNIATRNMYKCMMATVIVLAFDIIIERVAGIPHISFWTFGTWKNPLPVPQLQNYVAWGAITYVLCYYFVNTFPKTKNDFVKYYIALQMIFFMTFNLLWFR